MCAPGAPALIAAASTGLSIIGQAQATKSQNRIAASQAEAEANSRRESSELQMDQLNSQASEAKTQAANEQFDLARKERISQSRLRVASAESGAIGKTVDRQHSVVSSQAGQEAGVINTNLTNQLTNIHKQQQGAVISAKPPQFIPRRNPSPLLQIGQVVASGVGAFASTKKGSEKINSFFKRRK